MRVLTEDDFEELLAQNPVFKALCSDVLGRLLLEIDSDVKVRVEPAGISGIGHQVLPLLLKRLQVLNGGDHSLNFLDSLELLLEVGALNESERNIQLVYLNELSGLHLVHRQCKEVFKLFEDSAD